MSRELFDQWITKTLEHEGIDGKYTEYRDASGKIIDPPTRYGIILSRLQEVGLDKDGDGDVDIADLKLITIDDAINIYFKYYWLPEIEQLSQIDGSLAVKLFDITVNTGPGASYKLLQRAVNFAVDGDVLQVDGRLGSKTFSAIQSLVDNGKASDIMAGLITAQSNFYLAIVNRKPEKHIFLRGWLSRAQYNPVVADSVSTTFEPIEFECLPIIEPYMFDLA